MSDSFRKLLDILTLLLQNVFLAVPTLATYFLISMDHLDGGCVVLFGCIAFNAIFVAVNHHYHRHSTPWLLRLLTGFLLFFGDYMILILTYQHAINTPHSTTGEKDVTPRFFYLAVIATFFAFVYIVWHAIVDVIIFKRKERVAALGHRWALQPRDIESLIESYGSEEDIPFDIFDFTAQQATSGSLNLREKYLATRKATVALLKELVSGKQGE